MYYPYKIFLNGGHSPLMERLFGIRARGSSLSREVLGGATTYLTMVYIVFVHPVVMAKAGMDFGAVTTATCIASRTGGKPAAGP